MYQYRIYGLGIESDYQMNEADAVAHLDRIDVTMKAGILNREYTKDRIQESMKDKFLVNVTEEGIYLQVAHQGTFLMERGKTIRYHLESECNLAYVEQIILCFCLGIIMVQLNRVVLHGSGIVIKDKVFVISGKSGAGKSALSTAFINSGFQYISDDTVAIECSENVIALPGYSQRKLYYDTMLNYNMRPEDYQLIPDAEDVKYSVKHPDQYHREALALGGLIVITPSEGDTVRLIPIRGNEKIKMIIDNLYKKEIYDLLGFNKDIFNQCVKIAKLIDVYVLTRPVNQMTMKEQMDALDDILIGAK